MPPTRFRLESAALLVVDMQEKLVPHMHNAQSLVPQVARLLDGANAINLPMLVTEHYRKGLGVTLPELQPRIARALCNQDKVLFSACVDPVLEELRRGKFTSVIVCGVEAHVCVLQTCLDLLEHGYNVALTTDAIGSRRPFDMEMGIERLIQAGVAPTTVESMLFELVREAGTPLFKAMLNVVK
ncbi:MAG: isochorismatase family protein [Phycisphaeraceae bacterium]|nr:isochorismatase family protein [Phycisphaeraceae bacterium]